MNGWRLESALPLGRVCRGLDVGGLVVAAVFELPTGDAESLSGASLRLAEDLVATLLSTPCAAVRVAGLAPSGRPVARVAGMSSGPAVSVSHVRGLLGAAAVVTGVGRFATVGRYVVAIAATAPVTRHDRAVVRAIISTWWGVAVPSAVSSPDVFTRPWLIDARRPGPSAPSLQECPA